MRRLWTRRGAIGRAAAMAAGGMMGPGLLGGRAFAAALAAARPASTGGKIKLLVGIPYQGATTFQGVPQELVDSYISKNWLPSHPGVEVTTLSGMGCNGTCLGAAAEIAATLAGQPADVIEGCCQQFVEFQAAGMLMPLEPFLKQDNISLAGFSPGHIQTLTTPQGLLALPEYDGAPPIMVNLGMLDELGLAYPEPGWTYEDATRLWRAIAGHRNGKQIYGMGLVENSFNWVTNAFGGSNANADRTRWTIDSPQGAKAFEWLMPLFWDNIVNLNGVTSVVQGSAAMGHVPSWELQYALVNGRGLKWDLVPPPVFPYGKPSTYDNSDFNAINAQSKNPPELLWDIFKFITLDPGFARLQYRISLFTPNQLSLWPDWFDVVFATVPLLRTKHIEYFQEAISYAWPRVYMAYEGVQAKTIELNYFNEMIARKIGVAEGLQAQTREINALQVTGQASQAAQAKELSQFQAFVNEAAAHQGQAPLLPPARTGVGAPPKDAASQVKLNASLGTVTVTGAGGGYLGSSDGGTFACAPSTKSQAAFSCRISAIAPLKGAGLVSGAKIALMARGDLSTGAAAVALEVAIDRGVHFQERAVAGDNTSDTRPSSSGAASGLIGSGPLLVPSRKPAVNYLLKPVWLKLVRQVGQWVGFTSWDGETWVQAAGPTPVALLGAWVGLFVTSHQNGHYLQAVFDHLSGFLPDTFVQIGTP